MRISDWSSDVCSSDLCSTRLHLSARAFSTKMTTPASWPGRRSGSMSIESKPKTRAQALVAAALKTARQAPPSRASTAMIASLSVRAPEASSSRNDIGSRSEEHTSELQSLMRISYAVFCLKKKKHAQHLTPEIKHK